MPNLCQQLPQWSLRSQAGSQGGINNKGRPVTAKCNMKSSTCKSYKPSLKNFTLKELETFTESIGEPRKRAKQIWLKLYGDNAESIEQRISKSFIEKVASVATFNSLSVGHVETATDSTKKLLLVREKGGTPIETVLIPTDEHGKKPRTTVCVSSQIGCNMGCKFCFTGMMGLQANLSTAEIVEQVITAKQVQRSAPHVIPPVTNIVFMGMGEPFQNTDAVLKAINILSTQSEGYTYFSHKRITVSTVGIVPEIKRFAKETSAQLALSLHATTEESRSEIVPANHRYSLHEVIDTLEELFPKEGGKGSHGRHVLIEYVMLKDVNDSIEDAKRLTKLLRNIECKINLIEFNSFEGVSFIPSDAEQIQKFRAEVARERFICTIRSSRGDDKMAACGQLGTLLTRK